METLVAAPRLVRLSRPWFWPLGWGGLYFGSGMATHAWLPGAAALPRVAAAMLVLGPLVWTAVLSINDLHDLPTDRLNPRKATAPLVTGELTGDTVAGLYRWSVVAAVVVSLAAGPVFAAGTVAVLLLGHLYSVPPVRLKARPGWDVLVNAVVIGVFTPVAGWSLHRPVTEFPPVLAVLGLLLAAALYLPTTVLDREADRAAGIVTAAVRWSPAACRRAGLALWVTATLVWLWSCHSGVLVQRPSWWLQDLFAPLLVAVYAAATRRPTIARMAVVTAVFAVPAADFLAALISAP